MWPRRPLLRRPETATSMPAGMGRDGRAGRPRHPSTESTRAPGRFSSRVLQAAKKFYPMFEMGKVYYVSKGPLKIANKQFKMVKNDYEMTLNENTVVDEAEGEIFIPRVQYSFVKIDQLGPYVNGRELVDIVGVLQSVSPTLSVRRKMSLPVIVQAYVSLQPSKRIVGNIGTYESTVLRAGHDGYAGAAKVQAQARFDSFHLFQASGNLGGGRLRVRVGVFSEVSTVEDGTEAPDEMLMLLRSKASFLAKTLSPT